MSSAAHPAARKVRIPKVIADVDARWLTEALSTGDPGLEVLNAEVLESLGGACTKLRVRVATNRPDFPATVIVKGCLEPHCDFMKPNMLREVQHARVVPRFGVETIKFLFAQGDEQDGAVIIMEDLALRGATCLRNVEPITDFKLMADFLTDVARIHATWWDAPEARDGGPFEWIWGLKVPGHIKILEDTERFAAFMELPRATATPVLVKDRTRLIAACHAMAANDLGIPLTIIHGDLNLSNLYTTAENTPGFLDWSLRRMPWGMDVSYFIVGCLDVVDRRRWEGALLQHYLDALGANGVDAPDFDTAWLGYRAWPIWGEMTWLVNRVDFHNESAITAAATRFGHAMVDLDTFAALGV